FRLFIHDGGRWRPLLLFQKRPERRIVPYEVEVGIGGDVLYADLAFEQRPVEQLDRLLHVAGNRLQAGAIILALVGDQAARLFNGALVVSLAAYLPVETCQRAHRQSVFGMVADGSLVSLQRPLCLPPRVVDVGEEAVGRRTARVETDGFLVGRNRPAGLAAIAIDVAYAEMGSRGARLDFQRF